MNSTELASTSCVDRYPPRNAQRTHHRRAHQQPRLRAPGRDGRRRRRQGDRRRPRRASRRRSASPRSRSPAATRSRPRSRRTAAPSCCGCCASVLDLPIPEVAYDDLERRRRQWPTRRCGTPARQRRCGPRADGADDAGTLFDHPLLRLPGRRPAGLPGAGPDRVPVPAARSTSSRSSRSRSSTGRPTAARSPPPPAVRRLRAGAAPAARRAGPRPAAVSHEVVLVCPENFSNRAGRHAGRRAPAADRAAPPARPADPHRRRCSTRCRRPDLRPGPGRDGMPTRPVAELADALGTSRPGTRPTAWPRCDLSYFCRDEARGYHRTCSGRSVREELGGVDTVGTALGLADGALTPVAGAGRGGRRAARRARAACARSAS